MGGASSSSSKRRLPTGFHSEASSARLTRNPEDEKRENQVVPGHATWEKESGGTGKKEPKDEFT